MRLLRTRPAFGALWYARLVSFLGDSLERVALILYVARSGNAANVGLLLLAAEFVPTVFGPFTGALADRVASKRRFLVTCELLQGAVVAVIALTTPPFALLLALVTVRNGIGTAFQPAARSAIPDLVEDDELDRANALLGFGTFGLDAVGPIVAAVLLRFVDVRDILLFDAATFLAGALLLLRLPPLHAAPREEETRLRTDALDGIRYVLRDRFLRALVLGFAAVVVCTGVDDVALVFFATDTLHAGERTASVLYAGSGIGLLVGFLLLARRAPRATAAFAAGLTVSAAGNALTGATGIAALALAFQVVRGLGVALVDIGHNNLIQRNVPAHLRGRAFANLYAALGISVGIAFGVGGPLVDAIGPRAALVGSGVLGVVAALLTAARLGRPS
ncbi:MAG TPA: MFS transporter [Frankiaceae bacterium]|nr:MFS transporter [Frankiaceae bacterium]